MSSKSKDEIWNEWRELVNIQPKELEEWLETEESKNVGDSDNGESTGHKSGRKIVKIKNKNKDDLTDDDYDHMGKVIGYINRHCKQGGPDDDIESSTWRYSLMNWGHDPCKEDGCA